MVTLILINTAYFVYGYVGSDDRLLHRSVLVIANRLLYLLIDQLI